MLNSCYKFIGKYQNKSWFWLPSLLIITCLVMISLPLLGIPIGADLTQHLQFASTYHDSILTGDFFPGWAASDNYGFGSIGIRFYPPIAYYLLAFTQMLTADWFTSLWTNAFVWMFLGCLGMYWWSREWLSPIESISAALFYAFAPYHRFQIYQLLLFAEFAALGVLPFCFLTVTRLIRRGGKIDVVWFAISLAVLMLTHIPTTILGLIGIGIYAFCLMDWKDYPKKLVKLFIGFILGLSAASFHWLRLITELNWVKHNEQNYAVDFYDYKQHFFPLAENLKSILPPLDSAVILIFLSLLPLAFYFVQSPKSLQTNEKRLAIGLLATGFCCLFMMTVPSVFVWENVPVLQKVQFPWRWLSIASVIASPSIVFAVSRFVQTLKKPVVVAFAGLFSLMFIYFFVQTITPSLALNHADFQRETAGFKEKKGCQCWQPRGADDRAFNQPDKVTADAREVTLNFWKDEKREFKIGAGIAQNIRIATFYYPYWQAEINGKPAKIEADSDGSISIPVGETESIISLNFREPLMLQLALGWSLLTWLTLFSTVFLLYQKSSKKL